MKRISSLVLAALVLAGWAAGQEISFKPPGTTAAWGLPVKTLTTTISAVRARTLFSDPLEILAARPGYAYLCVRSLVSHPAGVNHTTSSVTAYGVYYKQGGVIFCRAALGPATYFADRFGMATSQTGYTDLGIATSAPTSFGMASALVIKTVGANLSGSGAYDIIHTIDYVEVPIPGGTMVFNGAFTGAATGWTLGAGGGAPDWAYSANTVTHGNGGGVTALQPTVALAVVAGHSYEIEFTLSAVSAGTVTVSIGGTAGTARGTSATFAETIVATTTGNLLFTPTTTFVGTLDAVTLVDQSAP